MPLASLSLAEDTVMAGSHGDGAPHDTLPSIRARADSESLFGLRWLLRLRTGAIVGQGMGLAVLRVTLAPDLPYGALFAIVGLAGVSNVVLQWLPPRFSGRWQVPTILLADAAVLTTMLALSGGASNPFTVFYLVHVALAALLLESWLTWALVAVTVVGFGSLFFVPAHCAVMGASRWSGHLVGMWGAYALSAGFVAHFVGKVSRALRERERQLSTFATQTARLATLSSFAANAAHELGTPLGTIGLAAHELRDGLHHDKPSPVLLSDAELVCREVERCRTILADLSSRAGQSVGEMPVRTTAGAVVESLRAALSPRLREHVSVAFESDVAAKVSLVVPPATLVQMLHNLVRNAFDAQEEAGTTTPVEVRVQGSENMKTGVVFHVLDRGVGIPLSVLEQFGEPFVTTKQSTGGLGLGVYLARVYAERMGGFLRCARRPGGGTDVALCVAGDGMGAGS